MVVARAITTAGARWTFASGMSRGPRAQGASIYQPRLLRARSPLVQGTGALDRGRSRSPVPAPLVELEAEGQAGSPGCDHLLYRAMPRPLRGSRQVSASWRGSLGRPSRRTTVSLTRPRHDSNANQTARKFPISLSFGDRPMQAAGRFRRSRCPSGAHVTGQRAERVAAKARAGRARTPRSHRRIS